jgi:DNA repair protein RecO (recombination protein O)
MTLVQTSAIVIKSIEWRETSKIISLFTRELGRIDVIAKGARSKKSSIRGNIESINMIEAIIYYSSNRELQILGNVTLQKSFPSIRSDLEKTSCALSMLELVFIFFRPGYVDQIFFDFFYSHLLELERLKISTVLLWYFLLKLVSYLGFKPEFQKCRKCESRINQINVLFSFKDGSIICNDCEEPEVLGIRLTRLDQRYLITLQSTGYKSVSHLQNPLNKKFSYTKFLIDYLNYHTDQRVQLKSLNLIN